MFDWLRRRTREPDSVSTGDADDAAALAERTLRRVEANIERREPVLREARGHVERNGIAENVAQAFKVRGAA